MVRGREEKGTEVCGGAGWKGGGVQKRGLFQNPGNTLEVKRDIEGRWREAITGNLNDYFRHQRGKKHEGEKVERRGEKKKKQERGFALKRFCRGGVRPDVHSRSSVVYVERDFW